MRCWATCHCQLYTNVECYTTMFYGKFILPTTIICTYYLRIHVKWPMVHWQKRILVCSWCYLDVRKQSVIADKSLHNFSVSVSFSVEHFTISEGLNQLWSNKYQILWICVVVVIQHAKCMFRVTLASVTCPTVPQFSTLSTNGAIFEKKVLNTKFVFWFSVQRVSQIFLILRRIQRHFTIHVRRCSCKVSIIRVKF